MTFATVLAVAISATGFAIGVVIGTALCRHYDDWATAHYPDDYDGGERP